MNCWKGVCKYKNENKNICTVDGKKCDMSCKIKYGMSKYRSMKEKLKKRVENRKTFAL